MRGLQNLAYHFFAINFIKSITQDHRRHILQMTLNLNSCFFFQNTIYGLQKLDYTSPEAKPRINIKAGTHPCFTFSLKLYGIFLKKPYW